MRSFILTNSHEQLHRIFFYSKRNVFLVTENRSRNVFLNVTNGLWCVWQKCCKICALFGLIDARKMESTLMIAGRSEYILLHLKHTHPKWLIRAQLCVHAALSIPFAFSGTDTERKHINPNGNGHNNAENQIR